MRVRLRRFAAGGLIFALATLQSLGAAQLPGEDGQPEQDPTETPTDDRGASPVPPLAFVDAHNHLMPGLTPEHMISVMDEVGISRIVLMAVGGGTGREGAGASLADLTELTREAFRRYPNRVIPFIGLNFLREFTPAQLRFIDGQLATGTFRGMGELNVLHLAGDLTTPGGVRIEIDGKRILLDSPGAQDLLCLAAKHNVALMIHMESTPETAAELDRALERNPHVKLIWAHQNPVRAEPDRLQILMAKHPNLYADISPAFPHVLPGHLLLPDSWRALYEQYSDRLVLGLDMPFPPFWREPEIYRSRAELMRAWLSQLSPETQRKLASENLDRILDARPASVRRCEFLTR